MTTAPIFTCMRQDPMVRAGQARQARPLQDKGADAVSVPSAPLHLVRSSPFRYN
jgi:hypothetical protein